MFSSLIHPQTVALLFPYDNALAADAVVAGENRSCFLPSQQSQRELDFLRDGMFPSSQEAPARTDPLAFCYRSPCLELRLDRPPNFGSPVGAQRRWTLGTSGDCDVVLPPVQPGPCPLHAAFELTDEGKVLFRDAGYGSRLSRFGQGGEGTVMGGTWVLGAGEEGIMIRGGRRGGREALFVLEMAGARFLVVIPEAANSARRRRPLGSAAPGWVPSLQKTPSQTIAAMFSGLSLNTSLTACD